MRGKKGLENTLARTIALSTFIKLMRATESVSADVHRRLTDCSLSISQLGILEALYHLGPMCQRDLAAKILKSAGNITMVIDNLEKRDLVSRDKDPGDRRYVVISLTARGQKLIADIFPAHRERIEERMKALNARELQTLGRLLKKLGRGGSKALVRR
jgi:MarR family 2-MHQ and catechol resistance regulon transcriptional repressor